MYTIIESGVRWESLIAPQLGCLPMAFSALPKLITLTLIFIIYLCLSSNVEAQVGETSLQLVTDAFEWPSAAMSSLYDELDDDADEDADIDGEVGRRSLFWRATRYYISYGALSANRIPCPPRSGRSYYTHNCFKARGPAHPYTRGCSKITRCRR
ncbi:hypothetical protein L1049_025066 [Liquidambar formosana]|uniref:Protein RALF-like 34 n=1 Tax=Liquidambar formosana TaxID=63359 RepID=A0AAP0X5K3_LIQFO